MIENERNTINQVRKTTYAKMLEHMQREEDELKAILDQLNKEGHVPTHILSEETKRILATSPSLETSQRVINQIKENIQDQEFQADNIIMVTGSIGNMQSNADDFCSKAKKAVKHHLESKNSTPSINPIEIVANLSQKL